jgi:plastocyanin
MRAAALILAVVLVTVPAADARKRHHQHHRRHRLVGHAGHGHAQAPASWTYLPPSTTATPAPTASPTATPAGPDATPTVAPTATPGSSLPPQNPHSVSVLSKEYSFTLSQTTVSAGEVHVQFDNSVAEDPHELAIDGPDPAYWDFGEQDAGTVTQRTITLGPGTYVLFCPLADHEARGMHATLTVH